MTYKYETMVGYSACTPEDKLKIPEMINMLQNCSMFHSASIGFDLNHYRREKKAWLLSSWQIEIEDLPTFNETLSICTRSHTIKGFFAGRNFWMERTDKTIPVKANTVWFYVDVETGKPVRVPQSEIDGYGCEEKLDMKYESRRLAPPEEMLQIGEGIVVTEAMLDTNMHVNNGQYIRIAYELIQRFGNEMGVKGNKLDAAGFYPNVKQICTEYKNAAKYGNIMIPKMAINDDYVWVDLQDEEGKTYAVTRFKCE